MVVSQADDLRNEALRKIGRNVVNLQKMERALKLLVVRSDLSGYISELKGRYQSKLAYVERLSMGRLADNIIDILYSAADENADAPDDLKEAWVAFGFRIEGGMEQKKAAKKALSLVVNERNRLVHKMLGEFDSASVESCRALINLLDQQQERIAPHFERIMGWLRRLHEGQMILLEVLKDGKLLESDDEKRI
ncbi:MAG TPA: hypothetical protein VF703_07430 [Pyrinomonadaceae bacterium]|jgi:hypothetical protein